MDIFFSNNYVSISMVQLIVYIAMQSIIYFGDITNYVYFVMSVLFPRASVSIWPYHCYINIAKN